MAREQATIEGHGVRKGQHQVPHHQGQERRAPRLGLRIGAQRPDIDPQHADKNAQAASLVRQAQAALDASDPAKSSTATTVAPSSGSTSTTTTTPATTTTGKA